MVHTASETRTILSRLGSIGGFFRNGLNQAKSIIGDAFASGSTSISGKSSLEGLTSSVKSGSKTKKKGSNRSKTGKTKKFSEWAEKLFDWAEIKLERLKTITDAWLLDVADSIGFIAKNEGITGAMKSVNDQIKNTSAAYDLYLNQADKVAKKAKLSKGIIQKIQDGTIKIESYSKETQEKIKEYQEW